MKYIFKSILGIIVLMAWFPIMLFKLLWHFKYYSIKDYYKLLQKLNNENKVMAKIKEDADSKWAERIEKMQKTQNERKNKTI